MRLYEIEDMAIKDLQKMRRAELEKYHLQLSEGQYGDIISSLYFEEKSVPFHGKTAELLL